jgi:hypothetical protein
LKSSKNYSNQGLTLIYCFAFKKVGGWVEKSIVTEKLQKGLGWKFQNQFTKKIKDISFYNTVPN